MNPNNLDRYEGSMYFGMAIFVIILLVYFIYEWLFK